MWFVRRRAILVDSMRRSAYAAHRRPVSAVSSARSLNKLKISGANGYPLIFSMSRFSTNAITGGPECDEDTLTAEVQAFFTVLENVARKGEVGQLVLMICENSPAPRSLSIPRAVSIMERSYQWDALISLLEALASNGALNDVSLEHIETAISNCRRNPRKAAAMVQVLAKYNLDPSVLLVKDVARSLAHEQNLKELLVLVDTLREHKYHPHVDVYHSMLHTCDRMGHWQVAIQIFDAMDATTGRLMTQLGYDMTLKTLQDAKQHEAVLAVVENLNKRCLRRHALEAETELALGDVKGALETVIDAHRMCVNAGENVYVALMKKLMKEGMTNELETLVISTIYQSKGHLQSWSRAARMWRAVGETTRAQMVIVDMVRFGTDPWQMCYKTILNLDRGLHLKDDKEQVWRKLDSLHAEGQLQTLPALLSAIACLVESNHIEKALELFEGNVAGAIVHTNSIMASDPSFTGAYCSLSSRNMQTNRLSKLKAAKAAAAQQATSSTGGSAASTTTSTVSGPSAAELVKSRKFLWMKRMPPHKSRNSTSTAGPEAARFDLTELADPSLRELWIRLLGELLHMAKKVGQGNYTKTRQTIEKYFSYRTVSIAMYHESLLQLITFRAAKGNSGNVDKMIDLIMRPPSDASTVPWTSHYNLAMSACVLSKQPGKALELYKHMTDKTENRTTCTSAMLDCAPNVRTHITMLEAYDMMKKSDEVVAIAAKIASDIIYHNHLAGSLHEDLAPEEEWRRKRENFVVINILEKGYNIAVDRVLRISEAQTLQLDPKVVEADVNTTFEIFSAIVEVGFKLTKDDYDQMIRALLRGSAVLGPESNTLLLKASEVFVQSMKGHRPFSHKTVSDMLEAALRSKNDELIAEVWNAAPDSFVSLAATAVQIKDVAKHMYTRKNYKAVVELFVNCARMRDEVAANVLSDPLLWRVFVSSFLHQASKGAQAVSETPVHSGVHHGEHHPSLDNLTEFHSTVTEFHPITEGPLGDKHGPLADFYFALDGASDLRLLVEASIPLTILEQLMVVGLGEPALIVLEKVTHDRKTLLKPAPRFGSANNSRSSVTTTGIFFNVPEEQVKFEKLLERLGQVLAIEDERRLAKKHASGSTSATAIDSNDRHNSSNSAAGTNSSDTGSVTEPETLLERFEVVKVKLLSTV